MAQKFVAVSTQLRCDFWRSAGAVLIRYAAALLVYPPQMSAWPAWPRHNPQFWADVSRSSTISGYWRRSGQFGS
jgi:hypothetical protein